MNVITSCHFNRPDYSARHAEALAHCRGIERYRIEASIEPSRHAFQIAEALGSIPAARVEITVNRKRLGIAPNTLRALRAGFRHADFVIHVEDDVLLATDALEFFEHCRDAYRDDARVFTVSAWNRAYHLHRPGHQHKLRRRQWFSCWGWATWWDRFKPLESGWPRQGNFGPHLNHVARGSRCEVFPVLGRSQNIGRRGGVNVPSPEWHDANQHCKHWAQDEEPYGAAPFVEVGE